MEEKADRAEAEASGVSCPVCYASSTASIIWCTLPCQHGICYSCLYKLQRKACPLCRLELQAFIPPRMAGRIAFVPLEIVHVRSSGGSGGTVRSDASREGGDDRDDRDDESSDNE